MSKQMNSVQKFTSINVWFACQPTVYGTAVFLNPVQKYTHAAHRQFSSVPWQTGSSGGHEGQFSRDPFLVFSAGGPLWAVLARAGMSTLWCCPSSISSADQGIAHTPRYPKGWFVASICSYDLQHDFAWVTDEAYCSVVLALLQVASLGKCDD